MDREHAWRTLEIISDEMSLKNALNVAGNGVLEPTPYEIAIAVALMDLRECWTNDVKPPQN